MALEIHEQELLYVSPEDVKGSDDPPAWPSRHDPVLVTAVCRGFPSSVRHNWSHDLESFFWLLLWFLVMRLDFDSDGKECYRAWGARTFHSAPIPTPDRRAVFTKPGRMTESLASYLPAEHHTLAHQLEYLRKLLRASHMSRKPDEHSRAYHAPYFATARYCLQACLVHSQQPGMTMPLEPLIATDGDIQPTVRGRKRPRSHCSQHADNNELLAVHHTDSSGSDPRCGFVSADSVPAPPSRKRREASQPLPGQGGFRPRRSKRLTARLVKAIVVISK
jgi:hypothetical protein